MLENLLLSGTILSGKLLFVVGEARVSSMMLLTFSCSLEGAVQSCGLNLGPAGLPGLKGSLGMWTKAGRFRSAFAPTGAILWGAECVSVQDLIDGWTSQAEAHALTVASDVIVIQAGRFNSTPKTDLFASFDTLLSLIVILLFRFFDRVWIQVESAMP